jgi:hypothetical protein
MLAALATVALSSCMPSVNAGRSGPKSGPSGLHLTVHTITHSGSASDVYALSGSAQAVTAYAGPSVDSNEREALWFRSSPVAQDEEACATWDSSPGITQDGVLLHMTQNAHGVIHGIAVVDNIWEKAKWFINIYSIMGATGSAGPIGSIQEGYDLSGILGGSVSTMTPLPWHMCARTVGEQVEFVMWTGGTSKPPYGTPGSGGKVTIPSEYRGPGIAGWYIGHIPPGSTATMSGLTSLKLTS